MAARLDGKAAIVTGAGTGIGEAIAHKFAAEGAQVLLNGLPEDPVEDVAQALRSQGASVATYLGDVSEEAHARACVQAATDEFGTLDVLVNNAGVFLTATETQNYPIELFDRTVLANVRSAFLMTRFALPALQASRGNVVSAGSEAGVLGLANNTPYGGTKGFMHAFMKGVAVEQAPYGVRANCVCPGAVDTAWTHKETGPMDAQMEQMLTAAAPMGRRGTAEEMANVYAFLASDEASYVTGACWLADGGVTIGKGPVGNQVPDDLKVEPAGTLTLSHQHDGLANQPVAS